MNVIPYILAGGIGFRLYPVSTVENPKQFLKLISNEKTMLQLTYERFPNAYIVCGDRHKQTVVSQMGDYSVRIINDPLHGTANAVWKAAKHCDPESFCLITPCDHYIKDDDAVRAAVSRCDPDKINIITVAPTHIATGYGYIHPVSGYFIEKPDIYRAKELIQDGYQWNTGIYIFRPEIMMQELLKYTGSSVERGKSVDNVLSEKCQIMNAVPLFTEWSDLGTFQAIYDVLPGNGIRGIGEFSVVEYGTNIEPRCLIFNHDSKPHYGISGLLPNYNIAVFRPGGERWVTHF